MPRCSCLNACRADALDVKHCLEWYERWSVQHCLTGDESLQDSVVASVVAAWVCDHASPRKATMLRAVLRYTHGYETALKCARFWQGVQARNRYDLFAGECARFRTNVRRTLRDYQRAYS